MESIKSFFLSAKDLIQEPLFNFGKSTFTLSTILYLVISIFLLFFLSSKLRKFLADRILAKYNVDIGIRQAISTILRYVIVTVGMIVIIQTAGIDMSFVTVLAGALGVGIGFGLQNITNNFVSGIVILVERPVKVGDRIEVMTHSSEKVAGDVISISARATTILTNDNISIIVPNSNLITSAVINWSYNDKRVRFNFLVPVHYNEDPELVKKILLEVARENDGVLKTPIPDVLLDEFADSSINYILRVWTSRYTQKPGVLRSQLYYAIVKKFREHNITIPYHQLDLYLKEVPEGRIKGNEK